MAKVFYCGVDITRQVMGASHPEPSVPLVNEQGELAWIPTSGTIDGDAFFRLLQERCAGEPIPHDEERSEQQR